MKLPAQASVTGAWVEFVWLWNLGELCINTKTHTHPYTDPNPTLNKRHLSTSCPVLLFLLLFFLPLKKQRLKKRRKNRDRAALHIQSTVSNLAVRRSKEPNRCFVGCRNYFGIYYFQIQFIPKPLETPENSLLVR